MKRELSFTPRNEILDINKTTESVIGAAIEVHRHLGPGLLESAYEECLCEELSLRKIPFKRQVALPVAYKNKKLDVGYRIDLLVNDEVVVELKTALKGSSINSKNKKTLCSPRLCGENKENLWQRRF